LKTAKIAALAALAAMTACAPASASAYHLVRPGETLWGIAAANGISPSSLAAANGLSSETHVVIGTTLTIPTAGTPSSAAGGAPPPMGGYTVQPGETLSGIAARSGVSANELAWMNGLSPSGTLLAGTALKLPTGASAGGSASAPTRVPRAAPYAAPGRTSSSQISTIASQHGVPGSLASAIAWQESGFNNGMVSSANARGVMQVMPGTWQWVEQNYGASLNPSSPQDNVKAGSLYLRELLRDTGGDERTAVAAYYQGLASVRQRGMLPETQRYVNNVMALRSRFGG
jgi:soluble lytic murein transglycosylase-like protein